MSINNLTGGILKFNYKKLIESSGSVKECKRESEMEFARLFNNITLRTGDWNYVHDMLFHLIFHQKKQAKSLSKIIKEKKATDNEKKMYANSMSNIISFTFSYYIVNTRHVYPGGKYEAKSHEMALLALIFPEYYGNIMSLSDRNDYSFLCHT